jgi:tetratricopeptide (TPR) repeat protein
MHSASILIVVVNAVTGIATIHGFSVTHSFSPSYAALRNGKVPSSLSLGASLRRDDRTSQDGDSNDDDDDVFDVEKARERLEALVGNTKEESFKAAKSKQTVERSPKNNNNSIRSPDPYNNPSTLPALDVVLPPASPLTTIERERRQAEIQLLAQLAEGDDSVADLWMLWFGERGSEAAKKLARAEELTNESPLAWKQAEDTLRDLIQEYGVYWVEPVNRLATLYYMQGRLDEAETLCQIVLAVKPWHFGALSGIVMVYAAQADSENARLWAASRLPTFAPTGPNRRRIHWAEKAVASAQESLEIAEKRVQELFGPPDDYIIKKQQQDMWGSDAWQ